MPRAILSVCLLLVLSAFSVVHAQTSSPKNPIVLRVLAEVVPEDLGPVYLSSPDGETRTPEFDLPANNVSEPIPVTGRALVLKAKNKDLKLCAFALPDAGRAFAVIFTPAKPSGYKADVVRTDDPTFKRGDVFFLNRTEQTILGKLGTKPLVLDPGKSAITRPDGATEGAYYDVAFAARSEGKDRLLSTVRWPVDEQIRSYIFFIQDANGRVTYRAVDEFVPPDKAGAAKP